MSSPSPRGERPSQAYAFTQESHRPLTEQETLTLRDSLVIFLREGGVWQLLMQIHHATTERGASLNARFQITRPQRRLQRGYCQFNRRHPHHTLARCRTPQGPRLVPGKLCETLFHYIFSYLKAYPQQNIDAGSSPLKNTTGVEIAKFPLKLIRAQTHAPHARLPASKAQISCGAATNGWD